jgi:hypothetical protein
MIVSRTDSKRDGLFLAWTKEDIGANCRQRHRTELSSASMRPALDELKCLLAKVHIGLQKKMCLLHDARLCRTKHMYILQTARDLVQVRLKYAR